MQGPIFTIVTACSVVLAVIAGPAWADDVLPPDWRGNFGTVTAAFDDWGPAGLGPGSVSIMGDKLTANPGGFSNMQVGAYASWNSGAWVYDTLQGRESVIEINPGTGLGPIHFGLINYNWPNPEKRIRIQVTFMGAGVMDFYVASGSGDPGQPPWPNSPLTQISAVASESYDHGDGWTTSAYDLLIEPNPAWETIFFDWGYTGPGTWVSYIDQVVIDTWCVPEPASLMLLAIGGLALLRRRK